MALTPTKEDVPPDQLTQLDEASDDVPHALDTEEARAAALRVRQILEAVVGIVGPDAAAYAVLNALDLTEKETAHQLEIPEREAGRLRKQVSPAQAALAEAIDYTRRLLPRRIIDCCTRLRRDI
jgi:hypothetical protein